METTSKSYLETTMFSFYYEERQDAEYQRRKVQARDVFELLKTGRIEGFTSDYTVDELNRTKDTDKREKMLRLISDYHITLLTRNEEMAKMASFYIAEKVVPESQPTDAAHIAATTVNGLDFIVSLNFEHIVRPWAIERVRLVNIREGYKPIGIYKPTEVLEL